MAFSFGSKGKEPSVMNVAANTVIPVSSGALIGGSIEYVANEVLVSWLIRRFMGMNRSLTTLARVHTLSLPLLGGAAGFMEPPKGLGDGWVDQFTAGAKGIPGVLIAHYINQVFDKGFTYPSAGMKEYLVTAVCKILSRPVMSVVAAYLPAGGQDALEVFQNLVQRQAASSNFSRKGI